MLINHINFQVLILAPSSEKKILVEIHAAISFEFSLHRGLTAIERRVPGPACHGIIRYTVAIVKMECYFC